MNLCWNQGAVFLRSGGVWVPYAGGVIELDPQ